MTYTSFKTEIDTCTVFYLPLKTQIDPTEESVLICGCHLGFKLVMSLNFFSVVLGEELFQGNGSYVLLN